MSDERKKNRRLLGISQRTTMFAAAIALLSIAFFAVAIIAHEKNMLRRHLEIQARVLATTLDPLTSGHLMIEEFGEAMKHFENTVAKNEMVVYCGATRKSDGYSVIKYADPDRNGIPWLEDYRAGEMWQPPGEFGEHAVMQRADFFPDKVLHYSYPVRYLEIEDWGWLHIGVDLNGYRASLAKTYRIIGLLALGSLLIGVVFAMRFARGVTQPILQLKKWAEWVAEGNFSGRVELHRNDEIGDLATSMNRMTGDLYSGMKREAELREKDVLLKEIHHRVKNNMQILSSLLRMQGRGSDVPGLKEMLRESESRIRSMGLIHEKLYQSESLSDIQFGGYAKALAKELQRMYTGTAGRVQVDVDVPDDISFALDTALPLGLMVNELVSNSLKYAFPDNREGRITIAARRIEGEEGSFEMTVSDDGVGLVAHGDGPKGVREGSLGTRLVDMLSDQLDGEANQSEPDEGGVATRIVIRESIYKDRL